MLLTEKEARAITTKMLGFTRADDATASVNSETYSHLRFAANSFLTSGRRENMTANVVVWINRKRGASSTNDLDDASLRAAVEEAERLASISPVDVEYVPSLKAQTYKPSLGYAEATANVPLADRAKAISDIIGASEKAGVLSAGFHQAQASAGAQATKNGNFDYERRSIVSLGMTARTTDGAGSGYFLRSHYDISRLDTARISREAIRRALESRSARTLDAGVYPVILEPQAVADLVGFFGFGFDARNAEEGRSAFSAAGGKTKLGEKIFDERINILSDPWRADLPGSQSTQAGIPAEVVYLVKNGMLENLVYSRFWAQKRERQPTPGPVNIIMEPNGKPATVEEMIQNTERGLLVSRFWYIRSVDPRTATLTGLTRDGVWLVENGKIQYPVRNFRFNQSIIQMLAPGNVEMIGTPERVGSSEGQGGSASLLPALKLKAFKFTSQSEAV
ncbi:MAG TPA: TldD/PmbA family protein [Pyrinomonadaceae bacterium]|nr:TldD/PmbA family protein [Pyrinomonadaceae bacterium]